MRSVTYALFTSTGNLWRHKIKCTPNVHLTFNYCGHTQFTDRIMNAPWYNQTVYKLKKLHADT